MISPQFDLMIISVQLKQEWSSMESSLYENWDEIEMLFGHLVIDAIGNGQLTAVNRKKAICNRQLVIGHTKVSVSFWT